MVKRKADDAVWGFKFNLKNDLERENKLPYLILVNALDFFNNSEINIFSELLDFQLTERQENEISSE